MKKIDIVWDKQKVSFNREVKEKEKKKESPFAEITDTVYADRSSR